MNPEKAIEVLDSVASGVELNRKDTLTVLQATQVLKEFVKTARANEARLAEIDKKEAEAKKAADAAKEPKKEEAPKA